MGNRSFGYIIINVFGIPVREQFIICVCVAIELHGASFIFYAFVTTPVCEIFYLFRAIQHSTYCDDK